MMAIASPSPPAPSFSTSSFCCNRADTLIPPPSTRLSRIRFRRVQSPAVRPLTVVISRLKASSSSSLNTPSNGFEFDGNLQYELQHGGVSAPQHHRRGSPVFVTLPLDAISSASGQMKRSRAMAQSFRALAAAGVEGVVMEVWWGPVEKESPRVYNWQGYLEIVQLAKRYGLKVRAVMAFHQCGSGPGDPFWISLPQWVLKEMDKNPDLAYSDRFGRRNLEYLSLGCDTIPVLHGRSPIQAYTDFMRSFRDTFKPFLGGIITGVQVGLGPAGELRYPSCPSQKLTWPWRSRELGEFQCYDKYMLASLNACASERGVREWANGGPIGASNLMHDSESTEFFKSNGSWNTPYGEFFLEWYSGLLLLHGDRICREAETIFRGTKVNMSGKVAGIHWHYGTQSHASELTAGYYNTSRKDGYLPIARMFARYGFTMRCTCFEMKDVEEQQMNPVSSPEGYLKQLLLAARACDISMEGENSATNLDDESFHQVLRMSKLYSNGLVRAHFSFNFNRMDKNLFEYHNWVNFTRFVRQMSDFNIFRAKLDFGGGGTATTAALSSSFPSGAVFAY